MTFFFPQANGKGWDGAPVGQEQLYRITSVSRSQLEARRRSNALNAAGDVGELEGYATLPTNCLYGWMVGSIEPWLVDGIT